MTCFSFLNYASKKLFLKKVMLYLAKFLFLKYPEVYFMSERVLKSTSHSFPFYTLMISLVIDNIFQLTIHSYFVGEDHEKKLSTLFRSGN